MRERWHGAKRHDGEGRRARRARIRNRSGGDMPPGKNARADASDGIFSGIFLPRPSAFGSRGTPPGRCGWVGSPEGLGRGNRNTLPGPLAQRSDQIKQKSARFRALSRLYLFCGKEDYFSSSSPASSAAGASASASASAASAASASAAFSMASAWALPAATPAS